MEREQWNQFVIANGPRSGAFLQSWGWGEFQKSLGKEIERRGDESTWLGLFIKQEIGLGFSYWYCPRGPIETYGVRSGIGNFVSAQRSKGVVFVRFDSPDEIFPTNVDFFSTPIPDSRPDPIRAVQAPHDVQPRTTILLDLKKPLTDLQSDMHPKTRYNIRVAERHRVSFQTGGEELFEEFWAMLTTTTNRNAFRSHAKSYYQKMLQGHHDPDLHIFVALARVDGKPAASAIMIDFAGTRTYLHGASDYALRDAMAPFALHAKLIADAQQKGMHYYDWWGIAPTDNPKEPLAGVTRFKKAWGGDIVRYPETKDCILNPMKYRFYRFIHRLMIR